MLLPINLVIILHYCICLNAKRTVLVVSIIEVILLLSFLYLTYLLHQWVPFSHPCQLIEAILMWMEPSILIRYGACCISAAACDMPVVEIIVIV